MIPLHVHSNYSLLEGTATVESLIAKAVSFNSPAIALTDTNGMHGLIKFYKEAVKNNIKPILGCMIDNPKNSYQYGIFLAKNFAGYSAVCKLITARKLKDDFSLAETLQKYFPDLFILIRDIDLLKNIPRYENIYGELISTKKERNKTRKLYDFCNANNIKMAVTNPVYFLNDDDYLLHKTVTAIKRRETVANLEEENLADEEFYFKSPNEIDKLWKRFPEAILNSHYIAESCNVDLKLGQYKFPKFYAEEDSFSILWKLSYEGASQRYKKLTETVKQKIDYELSVINELNLSDYFLVVWDILREAKKRRMVTIGRGSAANSIISYCLGFTEIDPIEQNLFFERFLNKSRKSPPDIDIDFSWKERDEIVKYVFEKYGYQNVAFISTHVTFKAKSAFRETAKVFGFSDSEISQVSKFIPGTDARNLSRIHKLFPESKSLNLNEGKWKQVINIASRLADFPRHLSIHPGGIVITPEPITNFTALEYAQNKGVGLIITQPDMYGAEDLGLIKIDLLSQRSLGVLRECLQNLAAEYENYNPQSM